MYKLLSADLPAPHPDTELGPQATAVHLLPTLVDAAALAGTVAIVIDALRASATIGHALAGGCPRIHLTLTVDAARAVAATLREQGRPSLLGGERAGLKPDGFDLGNSPATYTPEAISGRDLVFTTTNGTATLLHCRQAAAIYVASMRNAAAVCVCVQDSPATVHIVCAGTREEVSMEDALVAGAIVSRLRIAGRSLVADDSARMCERLYDHARATAGGVLEVFRSSRGGRNLIRIGHEYDIVFCTEEDVSDIVPVFNPATGTITTGPPAPGTSPR